jgi:uncharacterized membrane protein
MNNQKEILLLILILITGTMLRFYRLDYQSLWVDEVYTYKDASSSLLKIILEPDKNINISPLYNLIVHPFTGHSNNQEAILRLPSLIFGSLSILLFYFVARNWFGKNTGILAASILAISPFQVWYSQEARPYTMLVILSLLSIWQLQILMKRPNHIWLRIGFVLSSAATFYCHTVGIAFIGFLVAYILLVVSRKQWGLWLPIFVGIFLLILPQLYRTIIMPPIVRGGESWRAFHPLSVPYVIWAFSTGYSLGPSLGELHLPDRMQIIFKFFPLILPIMVFIFTAIGLGAFHLRKKDSSIFWCATLWFMFPLAFAIYGAIFSPNEFNVRYTILSFPAFILFLIVGLRSIKYKWIRLFAFGIIILVSMFSLKNLYFNERYHKENNRAAGQFLSTHAFPNDLVICSAGYTRHVLYYYYRSNDIQTKGYPVGTLYVKPDRLEADLSQITAGRNRFWLFLSRTFHSDPDGYLRKYSDEKFQRALELKSGGVELFLFTKILSKKS